VSEAKKLLKRRHRGSIRTPSRVRYLEAALAAALSDPAMQAHVALLGSLFPPRRGRKVTVKQLARALAACHPSTGKRLRKRVNQGFRREGDSLVSNVSFGFDVPLSTHKSITVAALVFKDEAVLRIAMDAMRQSARWLGKKMDRRLRRGGQNATVATGKSAGFFIPEKAGRDGQPQLHGHIIIPNLTEFEEAGRKQFCAGHFRRITRSAMAAQRRLNQQLSRNLQRAGYDVELVEGVCRLPSVPRSLCESLSPVSSRLKPPEERIGGVRRVTKSVARRRENTYLQDRPKKVLQPLNRWQKDWERVIGVEKLQFEKAAYYDRRHRRKGEPVAHKENVVPFAPEVAVAAAAMAPNWPVDPHGDVLENTSAMRPAFSSVGVALRKKLQEELSYEARHQVIEVDYSCSEKMPNLVEHTEALRTSLRLIFPRLVMHLKFSAGGPPGFKVTGAATGNPKFAQLVAATAQALVVELGQDSVRANWPLVLRWLHTELANRTPEPIIKAPATPPAVVKAKTKARMLEEPAKPVVIQPAPTLPEPPAPVEAGEPEWDLMP